MIEDFQGNALTRVLELEKKCTELEREARRHKEAREKLEKGDNSAKIAAENETLKKENEKLKSQIGTMRKMQAETATLGNVPVQYDTVYRVSVARQNYSFDYTIPDGMEKFEDLINNTKEQAALEIGRRLYRDGFITFDVIEQPENINDRYARQKRYTFAAQIVTGK